MLWQPASIVMPIQLGIIPRYPLMRTSQTPEGFRERARQADLRANIVILQDGESWMPLAQGWLRLFGAASGTSPAICCIAES